MQELAEPDFTDRSAALLCGCLAHTLDKSVGIFHLAVNSEIVRSLSQLAEIDTSIRRADHELPLDVILPALGIHRPDHDPVVSGLQPGDGK